MSLVLIPSVIWFAYSGVYIIKNITLTLRVAINYDNPYHLFAVNGNPSDGSMRVRGPAVGDSFSLLCTACIVLLIVRTYSFIMTINIILASEVSASEALYKFSVTLHSVTYYNLVSWQVALRQSFSDRWLWLSAKASLSPSNKLRYWVNHLRLSYIN